MRSLKLTQVNWILTYKKGVGAGGRCTMLPKVKLNCICHNAFLASLLRERYPRQALFRGNTMKEYHEILKNVQKSARAVAKICSDMTDKNTWGSSNELMLFWPRTP